MGSQLQLCLIDSYPSFWKFGPSIWPEKSQRKGSREFHGANFLFTQPQCTQPERPKSHWLLSVNGSRPLPSCREREIDVPLPSLLKLYLKSLQVSLKCQMACAFLHFSPPDWSCLHAPPLLNVGRAWERGRSRSYSGRNFSGVRDYIAEPCRDWRSRCHSLLHWFVESPVEIRWLFISWCKTLEVVC